MTPLLIAQLGLTLFVFVMLLQLGGRHGVRRAQGRGAPPAAARPVPASGPSGLLQPLADIIKLMFKEELRPAAADPFLFALAPIISATAAFAAFAVVPFGAETTFFGLLDEPLPLQVADVNVAILVIFAITSMSVYGIVLAGWSSNSKYSLLGGLRSSAQMISYELSYGLALAGVLLARQLAVAHRHRQRAGGHLARLHPALVRVPPAGRLPHLHDRRHRRDQPRAVRLSRRRSRSSSPAITPSTAA